ncbi:MAG: hypothetical protein J6O04_04470 [Selenomonadaceae bacterium]|nr:hypothetical protein [Selenomonadaceae bacterium]
MKLEVTIISLHSEDCFGSPFFVAKKLPSFSLFFVTKREKEGSKEKERKNFGKLNNSIKSQLIL